MSKIPLNTKRKTVTEIVKNYKRRIKVQGVKKERRARFPALLF